MLSSAHDEKPINEANPFTKPEMLFITRHETENVLYVLSIWTFANYSFKIIRHINSELDYHPGFALVVRIFGLNNARVEVSARLEGDMIIVGVVLGFDLVTNPHSPVI